MKRTIQYIATVIALTFVASCNVIEETPSGSGLIVFSPHSVATKALVNPENLTDQVFDVFDVLTTDGTSSLYVDNSIAFDETNLWTYQEAPTSYNWKDGSHRFFGYTSGAGTLSGQTDEWKTLSIAEKTITTAANQTDILYSDIFTSTFTEWKSFPHGSTDSVKLNFHHLLSAVSFTMENYTGAALSIESVTVSLPNKASATVDFSGTSAKPASVSTVVKDGNFGGISSQVQLPDRDTVDVLTGTKIIGTGVNGTAFVIWPQTLAKDAATITIDFGNNRTRSVSIPADTEWAAGFINAYHILIYPEDITLIFEVQPWEQVKKSLDTSTGSINMSNVTWMNTNAVVGGKDTTTVVNSGYLVNMFYRPTVADTTYTANGGYLPAQGYFTVYYPNAGKYKIGLIPAVNETSVDTTKYQIYIWKKTGVDDDNNPVFEWVLHDQTNGEDIIHDTIYFQVRANVENLGNSHPKHKAQIDIWFKPTGSDEWISAYSEIRANYALTIQAR